MATITRQSVAVVKPSGMTREQAVVVCDKAREVFPHLNVYACPNADKSWAVKVRDRSELICKFESPDVNLENYR